MPGSREAVEGGHCIVGTAYDDATQLVTCDNSWGPEWGIAGRFKIPYAYAFDPSLADDYYAVLSEAS